MRKRGRGCGLVVLCAHYHNTLNPELDGPSYENPPWSYTVRETSSELHVALAGCNTVRGGTLVSVGTPTYQHTATMSRGMGVCLALHTHTAASKLHGLRQVARAVTVHQKSQSMSKQTDRGSQ